MRTDIGDGKMRTVRVDPLTGRKYVRKGGRRHYVTDSHLSKRRSKRHSASKSSRKRHSRRSHSHKRRSHSHKRRSHSHKRRSHKSRHVHASKRTSKRKRSHRKR